MKIKALAPWYGSNRLNAERVGELLQGCEWVGIPFAGGMCEIPYITARTIVANDLHEHLHTLARAVKETPKALQRELRMRPFHPRTLARAQDQLFGDDISHHFYDAVAFFIVAWMTRSGTAGTPAEKTGKLALRWSASGGDSARRYQSAIDSLPEWCEHFQRCTFSCLDAFEFLDKCQDKPKHGIYCDPPFISDGRKYTHNAGDEEESWHCRLSNRLFAYVNARIVVRAYDCGFVRMLYPESYWTWHEFAGRKQTNETAPEVLIVSN